MATLVLTAVGTAIGGPIGGAIGAALGQQVDRSIFAPAPRQGARIKELEVQTSSYGTQMPAIFGAMRVAGTVIWATDLQERKVKSGGGKGRPSAVNYSYSVSMAVALSSRPIAGVGRIWADGNLLRGAAGDFKVDTTFRLHHGFADQLPDPLMASAEAAGQCPAHRGIAYAVFEDLQLADYGNRIPSLTFEIFERDTAVPVHEIFAAISKGVVSGESSQAVSGFAVAGEDAQAALAPLLAALPLDIASRDGALVLTDSSTLAGGSLPTIVVSENRERLGEPRQRLDTGGPQSVSLRYFDRERDFQAGLQHSQRYQSGRQSLQIELPAVIDASQARRIVEAKHARAIADRASWSGNIALDGGQRSPGDCFCDGDGKLWRIEEIEHRFGSAAIKARSGFAPPGVAASAISSGRNIPAPDLIPGETRIALLDMPAFGTTDPGTAQIALFASGTGTGWRRASLSLRQGSDLLKIGATAPPAVMGVSVSAMGAHNPLLIDEASALEIELFNAGMDLPDRSGSPLDPDAPTVALGNEYLRCGRIEALGNRRFRLSRLLRNLHGTEAMAPHHLPGRPFVLLAPETARLITEQNYAAGEIAMVEALGLGDNLPVSASVEVDAAAITPLPPVHGKARMLPDGSVTASWIRRSRVDLGWRDGVDQIMAEGSEHYLVALTAGSAILGQWSCAESRFTLDPAAMTALNIPPASHLAFTVREVGRYAQSGPCLIPVE